MHARLARRIGVVCSSLALVIAIGCEKKPEIISYEVPRDKEAPFTAPPVAPVQRAPAVTSEPSRMIAAAVLRDGAAWYVKATGSEKAMGEVAGDVNTFIKSLKLPEDQSTVITWEVPEGWKEGPARMMREATFVLSEGESPVEVAISKLAYDGDENEYLLANINRWRGQLGLEPVKELNEDAGVTIVELDGGKAWVFDGVGTMAAGGGMPPMMGGNAPFAGGAMPSAAPATPQPDESNTGRMIAAIVLRGDTAWFLKTLGPKAEVAKAAEPIIEFMKSVKMPANAPSAIEWKVPVGWQDGGPRMMREATLIVSDSNPPVEVAISKLSFPGNKNEYLLSNINRWRGQLGLPPVAELNEAAGVTEVDLDGSRAWLFDATGELVGGGAMPPMMGGNAPFAGGTPAAPQQNAPASDEEKE